MAALDASWKGRWIAMLMFALIPILLAPHNRFTTAASLACFVALIPLSFNVSQSRKWCWVAVLLLITCVAYRFVAPAYRGRVLGQASGYVSIATLLYFMAYIPFVIRDDAGIGHVKRWIKALFNRSQSQAALCGAAIISPMVSVAAVPLVSQIIATPPPTHKAARYTAIGTTLSMIWAPSFAPIAMVLQAFPAITWVKSLLITLPIFGFGLYFYWPKGLLGGIDGVGTPEGGSQGQYSLLSLMLIIAAGLVAGGIGSTVAISTAFAVGLIAYLLYGGGRAGFDLFAQSAAIWTRIGADAALFVAAGCMAASISALIESGALAVDSVTQSPFSVLAPIAITTLLPLVHRMPIHPVLLFSLFFPILSHDKSGLEAYVHYASWTCYWSASLLVSPVSVVNLSVATAFSDHGYAKTMKIDRQGSIVFGLVVGCFLSGILYALT